MADAVSLKRADAESIKRAFDIAFTGMCAAPDFDTVEAHFGHALGDLYRLYELARQPPSNAADVAALLETSPEGRTALAAAWSRKFRTHDLLLMTEPGDLVSDYYTDLYGVLAWRDSGFIASAMANPARRRKPTDADLAPARYYADHLAGQPVLDTLQRGFRALLAVTVIPQELLDHLAEAAEGNDELRVKTAGEIAGYWMANPASHQGHELIAAGLLLLAGYVDGDQLLEAVRAGYERGRGSMQGYDPSG